MNIDLTKNEILIISEVLEGESDGLSEHNPTLSDKEIEKRQESIDIIQQKLIAIRDFVSIDKIIEKYSTDEKFTYHEACRNAGEFIRCLMPDFPEDCWYSIGKYWDLQLTNDVDGKQAIIYPVIWNERRNGKTDSTSPHTIFQVD